MADRTPAQPNTVKEEVPSIKQELPVEDEEEEASTMRGEDDSMSFQSVSDHTIPSFMTSSPIVHKETDNLSKYLKMFNVVSNAPIDYVHWDDPNELVDRLRLLLASRAAGSNSHVNEINSIIEELREAEIIY